MTKIGRIGKEEREGRNRRSDRVDWGHASSSVYAEKIGGVSGVAPTCSETRDIAR